MSKALPVKQLPPDAVDIAARAVAAEVSDHISAMYPKAAGAVSMASMSRSLAGVIRNNMARLGKAAERGELETEAAKMKFERMRRKKIRRAGP